MHAVYFGRALEANCFLPSTRTLQHQNPLRALGLALLEQELRHLADCGRRGCRALIPNP